jgi:hypothetical protein
MKALGDLRTVFGEDFGTAQVLTTPSDSARALAVKIVEEEVDIDLLVRDLAILAAREVANALSSHALRPADYVSVPRIWETVLSKISGALGRNPEAFIAAFQEHLQMRG